MPELLAKDLSLAYAGHEVVHELSLSIPSRRMTALIGPNGSGKSTLLRGLARLMRPERGAVYLDGEAIHGLPTKAVARRLAILPQRADALGGLTVRELVTYGRFPHQGFFGTLSADDDAQIESALITTGIDGLADRLLGELSGGQRQLAWIAMALAQNTELLLLDEPTTFLDMAHQLDVLEVLERLQQEQQRTIVLVLHDINQAARYADWMVALVEGRIAAIGTPHEVILPHILAEVFAIDAEVRHRDDLNVPFCIPVRRRR
jgi:ABC-type cobalamin/Fe3+-siderophores transport system ATPase subunit